MGSRPPERLRIPQTLPLLEREGVYCAVMVRIDSERDFDGARVRAYYGAWKGGKGASGVILSAHSADGGRTFVKDAGVVIACDTPLDAGFASEPCVFRDDEGRWRMLYEACGTGGITRILEAVAA